MQFWTKVMHHLNRPYIVMDWAPYFDSFGMSTSCIQIIVGLRFSYKFDSKAADESFLFETCTKYKNLPFI